LGFNFIFIFHLVHILQYSTLVTYLIARFNEEEYEEKEKKNTMQLIT
jgi:Na+-transporting methylmalonyl-CoA/oxaloacetate decarboxylase gamma subunit